MSKAWPVVHIDPTISDAERQRLQRIFAREAVYSPGWYLRNRVLNAEDRINELRRRGGTPGQKRAAFREYHRACHAAALLFRECHAPTRSDVKL